MAWNWLAALCGSRGSRKARQDHLITLREYPYQRLPTEHDEPPAYQPPRPFFPDNIHELRLSTSFNKGILKGWFRWDVIIPSGHNVQVPNADLTELPWFASFCLVAKDLPTLMRHGFHWDETNIRRDLGCIKKGAGSYFTTPKYAKIKYHRAYCLIDNSQDAQWVARIEVYSDDVWSTLR